MDSDKAFKKMNKTLIRGSMAMQTATLMTSNKGNPGAIIPGLLTTGMIGSIMDRNYRKRKGKR